MSGKPLPSGIYGITCATRSRGRSNLDVVSAMLESGVRIIQYREKDNKSLREKLEECHEIRKRTRECGALFIVNDHIDIALLCDADGVHIGQDDLPVMEVRKLIGGRIIGVSTHNPDQARSAMIQGADYIGVGPLYATQTKKDVCDAVGLDYLRFVATEIPLPQVAIGGIKLANLPEVLKTGVKTVALVTEITEAQEIPAMVHQLHQLILENSVAG